MARMMWDLQADFRLVTPAFLAGARNQGPHDIAELRPPSLIGALRFWWRALAWSRTAGNDIGARLATIRRWEAALFGAQASETGGGQGAFVMRMSWAAKPPTVQIDANAASIASLDKESKKQAKRAYNHGYAQIDRKPPTLGQSFDDSDWATVGYATGVWMDNVRASSIRPNVCFSLHFRCFKDPGSPISDNAPTLMAALKLMGLIGGVGARLRRGFGSLSLDRLRLNAEDVWACPAEITDYCSKIRGLLATPEMTAAASPGEATPYTAIDRRSQAFVASNSFSQVSRAHAAGLNTMRKWRSWMYQKNIRPAGQPKQPDTHHDHDWFYVNTGMTHAVTPPKSNGTGAPAKTGFGLPLKFFKPPPAVNADVLVSPAPPTNKDGKVAFDTDRRASPLFLHVHKIGTSFVPVWVYLPTVFLPGSTVSVTRWGKVNGKRQAIALASRLPEQRKVSSPYAATDNFVAHLAASGYTRVTGGTP